MRSLILFVALCAAIGGLWTPVATAAVITGGVFTGTGSGSVVVNTPNPNNNNTTGPSPNTLTLTENITFGTTFGFQLTLASSGGSTEYFVTKTVTNNTALPWGSFLVGVGCGTTALTQTCSQPPVLLAEPLSLDLDQSPTSSAGGALTVLNPTAFQFNGINVAPGQSITLTFSIDTCAACSGTWNITQSVGSAVPEPGTVGLAGVGVLMIAAVTYRRRRSLQRV